MTLDQQQRRLNRLERFTINRIDALDRDLMRRLRNAYVSSAESFSELIAQVFRAFGTPATWSITDLAQPQRQAFLVAQIVDRINALNATLVQDVGRSVSQAYVEAYYLRGWMLSQAIPSFVPVGVPLLPEQAVLAAITFPYEGSSFFERMGDSRLDFIRKVRQSITVSQIRGEGMREVQKRLADELGWPIQRRGIRGAQAVVNKGHFARTELIARTEMIRTSNLGAAAVDNANRDILDGWEWVATRDSRTDAQCMALDGRVFGLDSERSRPPAHARCRCTSVPVRKSNRALGLPKVASAFPPRETYRDWARRTGKPLLEAA